jgi:type II secretory pathway pseudopilin PulG
MDRHGFPLLQQRGFTYLGLLILIAVIGVTSAASLQVGALLQRRAAEEELLEIGAEFRSALLSYAKATPPGQRRTPASLQDLLKDPRYPVPRRHLRKLYADPLTGREEWGIVEVTNGAGILGIHSLSEAHPIKIGGFAAPFQTFAGKTSYRDWIFTGETQIVR